MNNNSDNSYKHLKELITKNVAQETSAFKQLSSKITYAPKKFENKLIYDRR